MISAAEGNQTRAGYGMQLSIGAPRSTPSFGAVLRNVGSNCLTQYPLLGFHNPTLKDLAASPQIQPRIRVQGTSTCN